MKFILLYILIFFWPLFAVGVKSKTSRPRDAKKCASKLVECPPFDDYLISAVKTVFPNAYQRRGYVGLKHYTNIHGLIKTLKAGELKAYAQLTDEEKDLTRNRTGDPTKIYLSFTTQKFNAKVSPEEAVRKFSMGGGFVVTASNGKEKEVFQNFNKVYLYFDLTVVATTYEYHLGGDTAHFGEFDPERDFLYDPRERLLYAMLLDEFFNRNQRVAEVVFHPNDDFSAISLSPHFKGAWVADVVWRKIISQLKREGISSFNGKPIEKFIRPISVGPVQRRASGGYERVVK